MVEPDTPVVHAVEAELGPAVLDPYPLQHGAVLVAEGDEQRVDAALLAADDQLGEHGGHPAVARRIADVRLVRVVLGRVDREAAVLVGGGGADVLHVGAVAFLGHREAAWELEARDVAQVALVVALGAQVQHRDGQDHGQDVERAGDDGLGRDQRDEQRGLGLTGQPPEPLHRLLEHGPRPPLGPQRGHLLQHVRHVLSQQSDSQ